jgi:hypothetical protein
MHWAAAGGFDTIVSLLLDHKASGAEKNSVRSACCAAVVPSAHPGGGHVR